MEPIVEEVKNALSKCENTKCIEDVIKKYGFKKVRRGMYSINLPSNNPYEKRSLVIFIFRMPAGPMEDIYYVDLYIHIVNTKEEEENPILKLIKPELREGEKIEILHKRIKQIAIKPCLLCRLDFIFKYNKK